VVGESGSEGAQVLKGSCRFGRERLPIRARNEDREHTVCSLLMVPGCVAGYWLELSACMLLLASPNSRAVFFPWKRMPVSELGPLPF